MGYSLGLKRSGAQFFDRCRSNDVSTSQIRSGCERSEIFHSKLQKQRREGNTKKLLNLVQVQSSNIPGPIEGMDATPM